MTAAGPWSVKGIDPKAREIAKDLARRSGLTLGDWLNQMIIEGGEVEPPAPVPTTTAPRRALDDLYREAQAGHRPGARPTLSESEAMRTARVLESLASRVEAGEHRASLAISGIDQSMLGVLARLDELDREHLTTGARLSTLLGEVRSAQAAIAERLSRGPEGGVATETLEALQAGLGRLETRMDEATAKAEDGAKARSDELVRRLDRVETVVEAAPAAFADAEKVETVLTRMAERLDHNDTKTDAALQSLNTSFANLDARLRSGEARLTHLGGQDLERRFQSLAQELTQKVEAARAEMSQRLRHAADGRLDKVEVNLRELGGQMELAEKRSAQAIDRIGREVMRVAHNLGERVASTEHAGAELLTRTDARMAELEARTETWARETEARGAAAAAAMASEMSRVADAMEARLRDADTAQAHALEKLGGEIERIAERLAERIAAADRRQAEAMDDVTDKVAKIGARFDDRQDQAAGELADRIRASETRTAQLLDAARGSLDRAAPESPMPPATEFQPPFVAPPPREDAHDSFAFGSAPVYDEPEPEPEPELEPAFEATPSASNADPFAFPEPTPTAPSPRAEPDWHSEADPFSRPAEEHEESPFNPDDDFAPPAVGVEPVFAPALFDEPPPQETTALIPPAHTEPFEPFEPAFTSFSVSDFAPAAAEPEPAIEARPEQLSTRQMLDAARQAAKRAAMGKGGEPVADASIPVPPRDGKAPRPFGITFPGRRKKETAPTLRTFVLASGIAGSLTAMGVGAYLMGGTAHQGSPLAGEVAANGSPDGALAPSAAPNAAVALTPLTPIATAAPPPKATAATPATPAPAVIKAAKATTASAKPAPPTPSTPAQLYAAAVGRLEGGDLTALGDVRAAADKGLPSAQFYLARLYDEGTAGLSKDPAQARHWTDRAAQGGDASAMYNLASYYYGGEGGAKDPGKAAEWFRKAAERGVVNGQYNLAQLYEKGYGVPQSDVEAYKWYLVAAGSGDNESRLAAAALKPKLSADVQAGAEHAAAALRAGLDDGLKTAAATPSRP